MVGHTVEALLFWGLSLLQRGVTKDDGKAEDPAKAPLHLAIHPFDLVIPVEPKPAGKNRIEFVGCPGHLQWGIDKMAQLIAQALFFTPTKRKVTYLRLIAGEAFREGGRHLIYYEIGTPAKILIYGWCTDFTEGRQDAKLKMDGLFFLLAQLFNLEIEEVTIPFEQTTKIQRAIEEQLARHHQ